MDSQDPDIKKAWFYLFLLQYSIVYLVIQVELFKKKSKNKQTQPMSQKNPLMNSNQIELIAILISFSGWQNQMDFNDSAVWWMNHSA